MEDRCRREVVDLHRFFQDWLTAALTDDVSHLARFEGVLAEDFEIITPDGYRVGPEAVVQALRERHGRFADRDLVIDIRILGSRTLAEGLVQVTYEEHRAISGKPWGWLGSALFRPREGAPHGVEWIHAQETYLPAPADD